jgi:hypothetical protein
MPKIKEQIKNFEKSPVDRASSCEINEDKIIF